MSLDGLLESLCFEECRHRKAYVEIKVGWPFTIVYRS